MSCTPRRPDLMLEHQDEQQLLTGDMACANKANKQKNKLKNIRKYQQLSYELLERRPRCTSRIYGKICPDNDWVFKR